MVERPVMMCGLEMEALTKRQETQLEVGVSKVDKIANISAGQCRVSSFFPSNIHTTTEYFVQVYFAMQTGAARDRSSD